MREWEGANFFVAIKISPAPHCTLASSLSCCCHKTRERERPRERAHFPCQLQHTHTHTLALVVCLQCKRGCLWSSRSACPDELDEADGGCHCGCRHHYGKWNGYIANAPAHNKVGNKSNGVAAPRGEGDGKERKRKKRRENKTGHWLDDDDKNQIKMP